MERNIINFACKADYSKDEALYNTVKAIFEHIKALDNFNHLAITNIREAKDGTLTGDRSEPEATIVQPEHKHRKHLHFNLFNR